ncbi:MAG TPA: hypothetical protein VFK40_08160 [Nitrososphaeraceae archaeon]|nr:hypothetical protein [Nitrososphaeraceae archaeon]
MNNFINIFFLFIVIIFIFFTFFQNDADAISPSFPRQVIIDGSRDWFQKNLLKAPDSKINSTQCIENKSFFSSYPDREEINYLSDGNFLNATVNATFFYYFVKSISNEEYEQVKLRLGIIDDRSPVFQFNYEKAD